MPKWLFQVVRKSMISLICLFILSGASFPHTSFPVHKAGANQHLSLAGPASIISASIHKPLVNSLPTTSLNYGGFYVGTGSGSGFKEVEGNYNIPCTTGGDSHHEVSDWVGIGGIYGNKYLLQVGTQYINGFWHSFFETFPNPPNIAHATFSCGSHVYARVDYGVTQSGHSHVYLIISGTVVYDADLGTFTPNLESADWIDERPDCGSNSYYGLTDFNWTDWSNAEAVPNFSGAGYSPINAFVNYNVTMVDAKNNTLSMTGGLFSDGKSYRNNWKQGGNDIKC